jgi:hypothetical protein
MKAKTIIAGVAITATAASLFNFYNPVNAQIQSPDNQRQETFQVPNNNFRGKRNRKGKRAFFKMFKNVRSEILEFLGISKEEFQEFKKDEKTLLDIAKTKGINEEDLKQFLIELHTNVINSNENLSEEQKDKFLERVDKIVDRLLNGQAHHKIRR